MLIILALYLAGVWLIFRRLRLVSWGWLSGAVTVLLGVFILAVFLALFNYLTPSGRLTVISRVVEVIPNVSGQVVEIPIRPNQPVKTGTVLFRMDARPFQYKVDQLQAALVSARQQAEVLKANYEQASANVAGLKAQVAFHEKRLADIRTLTQAGATTPFREQDTREQLEIAVFQLQSAQSAQLSARATLDSQIDGINTTVLQTTAQLDNAKWELEQTTVRAPADGYATLIALTVGDRALQARAVMSFIVSSEVTLVGVFSQNAFRTIRPGAPVWIVFDNDPGRIHAATVRAIPEGVGQGQVATSGVLARTNAIGGTSSFPAELSIPDALDRSILRLGMSGNATVFAPNAGVIGILAKIIVWVASYAAYL